MRCRLEESRRSHRAHIIVKQQQHATADHYLAALYFGFEIDSVNRI